MKIIKNILVIIVLIICIGMAFEKAYSRDYTNEETYYLGQISAAVEYSGLEYLGEIDILEVSQAAGHIYDDQAIQDEILKRAGLPKDTVIRRTHVANYGRFELVKVLVLEEEYEGQPLFEQNIVKEYLYCGV